MKLVVDFSKIMLYITVPSLKLFESLCTHFGASLLVRSSRYILLSVDVDHPDYIEAPMERCQDRMCIYNRSHDKITTEDEHI